MKILHISFVILIAITASAQGVTPANPIVKYTYTTEFKSPLNGKLIRNGFTSFYLDDKINYRIAERKEFDSSKLLKSADKAAATNPRVTSDAVAQIIRMNKETEMLVNQNFFFINLQTAETRMHLFDFDANEYFDVVETVPTIKWVLVDSFKIIGTYNCQKALGTTPDKNYIAWFTTAIPVNGGPDKIFGLPGFILEAETKSLKNNEIVRYLFKGINIPSDIVFDAAKYKFSTKTITAEENSIRAAKQLQNIKILNN